MSRSVADEGRRPGLSAAQQVGLVVLRSVIGWHFLYEGFYKWALPGWDRAGQPMADWSAGAYLAAATGPLAGVFHWLASSPLLGWVDAFIVIALIAAGLSLMLGLFTQAGSWVALGLLSLFYLAQIPLAGRPGPGAEGAYLLVNKTLIEWAAVLTLLVFHTGRIAGLDRLRTRVAGRHAGVPSAVSDPSGAEPSITGRSHGAHA